MDDQTRAEIRTLMAEVLASAQIATKTDVTALEDRLSTSLSALDSQLVQELHRVLKGLSLRLHTLETVQRELADRIGALEERDFQRPRM